ncbi:MAG: hypothetical protein QM770_10290 [Tepidisphaeraceae bacterium]
MATDFYFDLYPKSRTPTLDEDVFRSPPSEYRGSPFWAWNAKLELPQLLRQIEVLKRMGFGGFNLHSRTGLATEYLGPDYLEAVRACTEAAQRERMLCWLYDEDRWPSGFAGGLVTRDSVPHRTRYLLWTSTPYGEGAPRRGTDYTAATRNENGTRIGRYDVTLGDGRLASYRRLRDGDTGNNIWHAYVETPVPNGWFNGATYANTLSRAAIERFLQTTHDRFAEVVGNHFDGAIPAIFTDEPQFTKKSAFGRADQTHDLFMPWSDDFPDTFRAAYGQELLDHLPELFWNLPGDAPSLARYRYHDHVAERFASAFSDTISNWCAAHRIALTGHALGEESLAGQSRGTGEVMRTLRSFHLPGIDMLCDKRELTTAKQAQSVARQFGRPGVLSELYGVTNWDFDFVGHKAQGDWQAALGVTVRVPHLAWLSMAGEAKRDYPASISYQSPWFEQYPLIEDHFARVASVITRGAPCPRVGVIHPIESSWLNWGPAEQNTAEAVPLEKSFQSITEWLCFGLVDFDFISEALLPRQLPRVEGESLRVGEMKYACVIVPDVTTLRSTTLAQLESLVNAGGTVAFAGRVPGLVDAVASDSAKRLAERCTRVAMTALDVLQLADRFSDLRVKRSDGVRADSLLSQLRVDGDSRQVFICNTDRKTPRNGATITVRGRFDVTVRDTTTGTTREWPATNDGVWTTFNYDFQPHGHLLATLTPATERIIITEPPVKWTDLARLSNPVSVTLSEPNVLLLDRAQWRCSEGESWQTIEEILRIDNAIRAKFDLPPRTGRAVQPWFDREAAPVVASIQLRFIIDSEVAVASPSLALENATNTRITLDGKSVANTVTGWWVDEAIHTVALPAIECGTHELIFAIDFTRKTDLEWCYLLGDFGVHLAGSHARLAEPVRSLAWGDWVTQGLPFYAGNVTYHATLPPMRHNGRLLFPKFKAPLLTVGDRAVAFAPFASEFEPSEQAQAVAITAFGNRVNAFGPVHHADEDLKWVGPGAWRSTGVQWQDEYVLKRMGVLAAPIVQARQPT